MLILTFTHTFSGKKPYSEGSKDHLVLFMKSSETSFMDSPFVLPLEASVKFIYSEKATKILRNLHQIFDWHYIEQIFGGDFAKFCGLLRIYELYTPTDLFASKS